MKFTTDLLHNVLNKFKKKFKMAAFLPPQICHRKNFLNFAIFRAT